VPVSVHPASASWRIMGDAEALSAKSAARSEVIPIFMVDFESVGE